MSISCRATNSATASSQATAKIRATPEQKAVARASAIATPKTPWPDDVPALRGIEGILVAHKLLLERGAFGVLIGGLAEEAHRGDIYRFKDHKDVDIMVLSPHFICDRFEEGIDWWLPERTAAGITYKNANGITLEYAFPIITSSRSGLCLPSVDTLVTMRRMEGMSVLDGQKLSQGQYIRAIKAYEEETRNGIRCYGECVFNPGTDGALEEDLEGYTAAWESSQAGLRRFTKKDLLKTLEQIRALTGKEFIEDTLIYDGDDVELMPHVRDAQIQRIRSYEGPMTNRFRIALLDAIEGGSPADAMYALQILEQEGDIVKE